jgi:hypothetical protein
VADAADTELEVPATERLDQGAKPRLFADNVKLVEVDE